MFRGQRGGDEEPGTLSHAPDCPCGEVEPDPEKAHKWKMGERDEEAGDYHISGQRIANVAKPSAGPWKLTGPWRSGDPKRGGFVHRFYAERASPRQKVCLGEDYELAHQIVDGINGVSRSTAPKEKV